MFAATNFKDLEVSIIHILDWYTSYPAHSSFLPEFIFLRDLAEKLA